jgi:hypothetical protein
MTVNYIRLSVSISNPGHRSPEEWRKEIDDHVRIRLDPDFKEDLEVEIEETA